MKESDERDKAVQEDKRRAKIDEIGRVIRSWQIMYTCTWSTKKRAFWMLTCQKNCNLFLDELWFSFVLYKKFIKKVVYVHILVPLCMCRKFYNRLSLSWAKNKDVNALRNDCQIDRRNHVQYDENTSKMKKIKRYIILLTFRKIIISC